MKKSKKMIVSQSTIDEVANLADGDRQSREKMEFLREIADGSYPMEFRAIARHIIKKVDTGLHYYVFDFEDEEVIEAMKLILNYNDDAKEKE